DNDIDQYDTEENFGKEKSFQSGDIGGGMSFLVTFINININIKTPVARPTCNVVNLIM
ncbi:hypothetical protein HispidOSU_013806, partial [Sigmodon hispidus]